LISGGKNIEIGSNCFIGRNVVLDASGGEIKIGDRVEIRDNVRIYARNIAIGSNVTLGENAVLKGFVRLEEGAWLARGCDLEGRVLVEKAILGPYTLCIGGGDHARDTATGAYLMIGEKNPSASGEIKISSGCWTGARSVILKNVTLASNTAVGAGAVVTRSYPAGSTLLGVPARPQLNTKHSARSQDHPQDN
jgi:acetyltransferase-like isoleucine patch superfamily enzyme